MDGLLKLGLPEKRCIEVLKNKSLSARLAAASAQLPANPDKTVCNLVYNLATKAKKDEHINSILPLVLSSKIELDAQVDAGLKFLHKQADGASVDQKLLSENCGVGKIATESVIISVVNEIIGQNEADLKVQRYKLNQGKLLGNIRNHQKLQFSDSKLMKNIFDAKILEILGPKTEADMAKPVKTKAAKSKPAKEDKKEAEEVAEVFDTIEENFLKGNALKLHQPGGNQNTDGYITTKNTENLIKQHMKRTGGMVKTRFPPEPNGILHIGHAKAINFNFGFARAYNGTCNLRYDDTNPEKEEERFFRGIREDVEWLGYTPSKVLHASDYFDQLHAWAVELIKNDIAYVCHQQADELKGIDTQHSPWRNRPIEESLALFESMRLGKFEEGEAILRVKHVMEDGKKDFVAYRILYSHHAKSGDKWCIYPTYDFTHCLSDSLEDITHSLCTKEFQARRSSYYWLCNAVNVYTPVQWEYGRLNLNYAVVSKRKIAKLIDTEVVSGWDDPRLFTLSALRRRGVPAEAVNLFCSRVGVTMNMVVLDPSALDACTREVLNVTADRTMAILNPLKVHIKNFKGGDRKIEVLNNQNKPSSGVHEITYSNTVYIEQEDFSENAQKGFRRLTKTQPVALKYANVLLKFSSKNADGSINCEVEELTDNNKPKGFIHWVSEAGGMDIKINCYERLFKSASPEVVAGGFLKDIAEGSMSVLNGKVDKYILKDCNANILKQRTSTYKTVEKLTYQFERNGYFTVDRGDSKDSGSIVFTRTVGLKEDKSK
jgi:glutaminyl-tRNA synthetase